MTTSIPNVNGSTDPKSTPHGKWDSFPWEAFPEYAGEKSIIFRSADGRVVASAAKETGKATLTYPCDEFFYVTDGEISLAIHGGETFTLKKGDSTYLTKGTTVDFTFGENFANVAVFINHNQKIDLV